MISCPYCGSDNIEGVDQCTECGQALSDMHLQTPRSEVERSLLKDRVSALNPNTPVTVPANKPVGEVLVQMVDRAIGCVIVVDSEQQMTGIFSERDALVKLNDQAADLFDRPVSEFMTPSPQSLESKTKIAFAVQRMDLGGYRHLPIVEESGKLSGIISVRDILRFLTDKMSAAT
jgi:CBS domain-containing protein